MPKQPDPRGGKVYRGRRRLPKLPGRRYAAVIASAFMGATVVAFGSASILPDMTSADDNQSLLLVTEWFDRADPQNVSANQPPAVSVDSDAPDVWHLPLRDPYRVTSLWGPRSGRIHYGMDLSAPTGTPIYAVHDGVVIDASYEDGFGLHITIDHGNGVKIFYAHASALLLGEGTRISAGQMIARVGSTGNSSGPHLHFEVRVHDGFYPTEKFMLEHGVDLCTAQEEANGGIMRQGSALNNCPLKH